jgi:hypothetical protein
VADEWWIERIWKEVVMAWGKPQKDLSGQLMSCLRFELITYWIQVNSIKKWNWYCGGWNPIGSTRHCSH